MFQGTLERNTNKCSAKEERQTPNPSNLYQLLLCNTVYIKYELSNKKSGRSKSMVQLPKSGLISKGFNSTKMEFCHLV